ncbi:hypothetical protein MUK42_36984 [Musa troglodytarum]|uniref:Uncharacterized protein n=1 Tax=Musa troglodytarum TaxID=320322 RepID=A0A9E7EFT2_9LILI|nr:hypothetical protein MUK42_36984 [Musa troglodytarum]
MLQWARSNLNPTAQALIISTGCRHAAFSLVQSQVLASARKNSFEGGNTNMPKHP